MTNYQYFEYTAVCAQLCDWLEGLSEAFSHLKNVQVALAT
jgi:hypothetical protein